MLNSAIKLIDSFKDPAKEIESIRKGVRPEVIEDFLAPRAFVLKDVLERLHIPKSTYLSKKKNKKVLDSSATEKLLRLISVIKMASEIIGENEVKSWLYKKIGSVGNHMPIDLLDTEVGHRLVEQALLQIKYGVYN
jgi:putative toxin-antitoxin system antitoxin component (TIGR02293 family)